MPASSDSGRDEARQHLEGSALLLVGRVLSLVMGFVAQVVIVRHLSAEEFGAFAYALSWVALGQLICGLGLQRSMGLFLGGYDRDGDDARILGLLRLVLLTIGVTGALLVTVVLVGQSLTGGQLLDDRVASSLLAILVVLAPVQAVDDLLSGLLAYLGSTRAIFVRQFLVEPGLKLVVVALLVLADGDVQDLTVGYVAAGFLGLLLYLRALATALDERGLRARMRGVQPILPWRQVLTLTLPLLSTDLVVVCISSLDAVLLGAYRGPVEVGALRVVQPVALLVLVVFNSFALLYLPAAARLHAAGDVPGLRELYWRSTTWIAVLTFPLLAVTTSLAGPLTELMFGSRYAASGDYLALLALGTYASAAAGFNGVTIRVFGFLRLTLAVNAAAILLNVALCFVLIPRYGALGAATATALSLLAHNVLKQLGLRRCLGSALPPSPFRGPFLVIGGGLLLLGVTRLVLGEDVWSSVAAVVVASAAVVGYGLRSLDAPELLPALGRLSRRRGPTRR